MYTGRIKCVFVMVSRDTFIFNRGCSHSWMTISVVYFISGWAQIFTYSDRNNITTLVFVYVCVWGGGGDTPHLKSPKNQRDGQQ